MGKDLKGKDLKGKELGVDITQQKTVYIIL